MKNITFYSPGKEDRFVFDLLVKGPSSRGVFIDLGPRHDNVRALENLGWTGIKLESAIGFPWGSVRPKFTDYLSLGRAEEAIRPLAEMLAAGMEFRAATIRHDSFRLGNEPRDGLRSLMTMAGYRMLLGDVALDGQPAEDWWIHHGLASIMFDLTPYLSPTTTILPALPCRSCGHQ